MGHAYSALNLRLVLAAFGLVTSLALAALTLWAGYPPAALLLGVIAVTAVVDLVVISRRRAARRRTEPPGTHHSAFE